MIVGGVVAYRTVRQAWLVADLEQRGAYVGYWHEQPGNQDGLPEFLRQRVGDRWWSDVCHFSHNGDSYWGSGFSYHEFTEADIRDICTACGTFRKLQKFEIKSNLFSCDQISNWPHLQRLEELDVESVKLSDADLAIIGRMKGLKTLRIASARMTGDGLGHLARLPVLEELTLDRVHFSNSGSAISQGFASLKSLVVGSSPEFGDDAIACFGSPPQLEDVNFNRAPIGDRGLAQLLQSGKVRSLIINEGLMTDASFAQIANYKAPGWLVLSGMPLTDAGLKALAGKEFPTLILDHTALTDQAFGVLTNIKGLEYVSLSDTKISGVGAGDLNGDPKLKHLDLSGVTLTQKGTQALAQVQCSELDLSRTFIGDRELMVLAANDNLVELDVTGTAVTLNGIEAFFKTRKTRLKAAGLPDTLTLIAILSGGDEFNPDRYTSTSVLSQPGMIRPEAN